MRIALIILLLTTKALTFDLNVTKQIPKGLIHNGESYNEEDYPYVVSIRISSPRYNWPPETCAGSLIHKLFVLTTAHCVYEIYEYYIKVYQGSWVNNSLSRRVVKKFVHEEYDPDTNEDFISNDVSVLKIDKPFMTVQKYINIGGFPHDFANEKALDCIIIGFGLINDHTMGTEGFMSHVGVKHGEKACRGYNRKAIRYTWDQYLCTIPGQNTTCQGDNGGPMICNGLLYGVCSFSLNYYGVKEKQLCGSENLQTVHMFVFYFKNWINDIIQYELVTTTKKLDTSTNTNMKKPNIKKRMKSAGELIKPHIILHMISALLFYDIVL